jgi:hypothetical protein
MSYSFNNPCWNCKKHQNLDNSNPSPCKDEEEIREAIEVIHSRTYEQGHQGSGEIVLMCCRQELASK